MNIKMMILFWLMLFVWVYGMLYLVEYYPNYSLPAITVSVITLFWGMHKIVTSEDKTNG